MTLTWDLVPGEFGLCFATGCPLSPDCLRFKAGEQLPAPPATATIIPCVSPHCSGRGADCPCYLDAEPVRMARGFRHALDRLPHECVKPVRRELWTRFSQGGYYERKNGQTLLSLEEQEVIREVFARHVPGQEVEFDAYEDAFDFDTRFALL